jgi:transposase
MRKNTHKHVRKEYNSLPVKVSLKDFNRHIKPYLSVGTRGPDTQLSVFQIFNCILEVLHTGMQWYRLKSPVRYTNIYRHHNRWSHDGSYERLFHASLAWLIENDLLDLFVLHGDGSNTIAKKGALESGILDTSTRKERKSSQLWTTKGIFSPPAYLPPSTYTTPSCFQSP